MKRLSLLLTVNAIILLAAAFRLDAIHALPYGMHNDEAVEGLDALKVIAGARPIFLTDNNGREPLFVYLAAFSILVFGRTPGAIRIVSALAGILMIPGLYLAARALFGRRTGLLAAFIGAITIWPILLSRLGTRPALLPLLLSYGLWQGIRGWQTGRWRHWLLSGVLWGTAFYTYTPIRVMPLAILLFAGFLIVKGDGRRLWPGALLFAVACAVCIAPLAIYTLYHPNEISTRLDQATVIKWDDDVKTILNTMSFQTYVVAQMFVWDGDPNPRHNISRHPIFDVAMFVPFAIGWILALRRRRPALVFCGLWVVVGLLPTLMSEGAPHFLRSSGTLPVFFVFPALGLVWLDRQLRQRMHPALATSLGAGILLVSTVVTIRYYTLDHYLAQTYTNFFFDIDRTEVAIAVNRLLGTGWQAPLDDTATSVNDAGQYTIWIDARLWGYPVHSYIVPVKPGPESQVRLLMQESDPFVAMPLALIVPPEEAQHWLTRAPSNREAFILDGAWIPTSRVRPGRLVYRLVIVP